MNDDRNPRVCLTGAARLPGRVVSYEEGMRPSSGVRSETRRRDHRGSGQRRPLSRPLTLRVITIPGTEIIESHRLNKHQLLSVSVWINLFRFDNDQFVDIVSDHEEKILPNSQVSSLENVAFLCLASPDNTGHMRMSQQDLA